MILGFVKQGEKKMSDVMEITSSFITTCSEETIRSTPRHTNLAIESVFKLPSAYVNLDANDIEYIMGEGFSSQQEVGRYMYGTSNYCAGHSFLAWEGGIHTAMSYIYAAEGILAVYLGISMPIVGAVMGAVAIIGGFYETSMSADARLRAKEAEFFINAHVNYRVTRNYTLFGALHNGYGCYRI